MEQTNKEEIQTFGRVMLEMEWFQNAHVLSYLALLFYIMAFWGRWERRRRVGGRKDRLLQTVEGGYRK